MTFIAYVAAFVAVLGAFTYLCVPKSWHKGIATAVFVMLAGGAFALSFETAGQPKPLEIEWRQMASLPIIGFVPNQEKRLVYLWVMRDGVPVSYAYPWSEGVESMQDAWRAREQSGDEFYLVDDPSEIAEVRRPPPQAPKEFEP
jgi:hypothetical protein